MTEKETALQFELFTQDKDKTQIMPLKRRGGFFSFLHGYERSVLILIFLLATGIVSFSAGVERGKRIALLKNSSLDSSLEKSPQAELPPRSNRPMSTIEPTYEVKNKDSAISLALQPAEKKNVMQKYTILLVTYAAKKYAEREASSLKQDGLEPLMLASGKYTLLCVGNFPNKEKAKLLLPQFKKKYQDCYIRRL